MNFLSRTQAKRPVYYCDCTLHPVMPFLISDTHTIYKVLMRNGPTQWCRGTVIWSTTHTSTQAGTWQKHWLSCSWRSDTYCVAYDQVRKVKHYLRAPQQPPILYSPSETHWHHQCTWPLTLALSYGAIPWCLQCGLIRPSLPNVSYTMYMNISLSPAGDAQVSDIYSESS